MSYVEVSWLLKLLNPSAFLCWSSALQGFEVHGACSVEAEFVTSEWLGYGVRSKPEQVRTEGLRFNPSFQVNHRAKDFSVPLQQACILRLTLQIITEIRQNHVLRYRVSMTLFCVALRDIQVLAGAVCSAAYSTAAAHQSEEKKGGPWHSAHTKPWHLGATFSVQAFWSLSTLSIRSQMPWQRSAFWSLLARSTNLRLWHWTSFQRSTSLHRHLPEQVSLAVLQHLCIKWAIKTFRIWITGRLLSMRLWKHKCLALPPKKCGELLGWVWRKFGSRLPHHNRLNNLWSCAVNLQVGSLLEGMTIRKRDRQLESPIYENVCLKSGDRRKEHVEGLNQS